MTHPTTLFKSLADETRLRLYSILLRHELNVNELVAVLNMGQPRISRHLKILAESGLVTARRDGSWVFYSAATNGEAARAAFTRAVAGLFEAEAFFPGDLMRAGQAIEARTRETQAFFDEVAHDWEALAHDMLGGFDLPGTIGAALPRCRTLVDLGCGTGDVLALARAKAEQVIGVDGSAKMLERARERFADQPGFSFRIGELEHLPLGNGEADAAVMSMVLHHLSDPEAGLVEAHRVLAPGGELIVADLEKHESEAMRTKHGDRWLGFTRSELNTWLKRAGFEVESADSFPLDTELAMQLIVARKL